MHITLTRCAQCIEGWGGGASVQRPNATVVTNIFSTQGRIRRRNSLKLSLNTRLGIPNRMHITSTRSGQAIEGLSEGRKYHANLSEPVRQFSGIHPGFSPTSASFRYC